MRITSLAFAVLVVAITSLAASTSFAATSAGVAPSPMGGNGHSLTFDGRVFVVAESDGWNLRVLRPELVTTTNGFTDVSGAFSDNTLIQPTESCENALALCTVDADNAPYACDEDGNHIDASTGGAFACYDVVVIDSDACGNGAENDLRFRNLRVWIENPQTASAAYHKHQWTGDRTALSTTTGGKLHGIEPTITRDGRLLIYQGHPANDGQIDVLMYATNDNACGADVSPNASSSSGWRGPFVLSHMVNDSVANTRYRLGERTLRAADGTTYSDGALVHGAYPWVFPDGSAVNFTSVVVPCRGTNDPVGCGPRRGGLAVLGYPTNWGLAHIDGPVNPDTDQTVRLFFTSPGPLTFSSLPTTPGHDVWPFFGSNTSNYTEIVFDDGLDGSYAGVWLMNENVDVTGVLDRTHTPDTSGYFNTGSVENATFPNANNGPHGKALVFDGATSRVRVHDDVSLDPVNGITVEMTLRPDADVDCDANNNWRTLVDKGGVGVGAYSLVFEEGNTFQARVLAGGEQRSIWANAPIPVGEWSTIAFTYQASTGLMSFRVNGVETNTAQYTPATLDGFPADLLIGSPGFNRDACPDGNGAFNGAIEELRISRVDRFHAEPPPTFGEGEGEGDVVVGGEGEGSSSAGEGEGASSGGEGEGGVAISGEGEGDAVRAPVHDDAKPASCATTSPAPAFLGLLAIVVGVRWRRRA